MKNLFYSILSFFSYLLFSQINVAENKLYQEFIGNDEYESMYKKADQLLEKGTHQEKITANLIKSCYILYKVNTEQSSYYLNRAKALLDIKEDPINLYFYYYSKAIYYTYTDNYFEQLNNLVKAIKTKKKYNIIDPYFLIELNLLEYYSNIENYSKVFSISQSVLNQLKSQNIKYSSAKSLLFRYNAIASKKLEKYNDTKRFLDSAMVYAQYYNDSTQIARVVKYRADLFLDLKEYDKATQTALYAKQLFERHDKKNSNAIFNLLGLIAFEKKQYDTAKKYFEKVADHKRFYSSHFLAMSKSYRTILESENKITEAYAILKREDSLKNAISGQYIDNKILNLELDYQEFKNNAILENSKKQTWWILYMLALALTGIGLLSLLFYQRSNALKKLKTTQKKIEKANKKLRSVNFKLEKFGQFASHDLKAPIRSIASLTTFIEEDEPQISETSKEYLGLIHESVITTECLISNILTLVKAENKKFEKSNVSFDQIIQQVKHNLKHEINKNDIRLVIKNKPQFLYGNKTLLIQLFQNIINSLIHYKNTSLPLIVELTYTALENKITLYHNGADIETNRINKFFDSHNQEELELIDQYPNFGPGLGLYTTKIITNLHKIIIKVNSKKRIGTSIDLIFENEYIQ